MNEDDWWQGQGMDPQNIIHTLQGMYDIEGSAKRQEIAEQWIHLQNLTWRNHING